MHLLVRRATLGFGALALAAGCVITVLAFDPERNSYLGGMSLAAVGLLTLTARIVAHSFSAAHMPATDAYELGYQMGYDKGFLEGHASARPVVVPMRRRVAESDGYDAAL